MDTRNKRRLAAVMLVAIIGSLIEVAVIVVEGAKAEEPANVTAPAPTWWHLPLLNGDGNVIHVYNL